MSSVLYITPFKFLDIVSEQCFTSPPTQYRLYGRRFLQVKRPNQQYQSTEGDATKYKENNENN